MPRTRRGANMGCGKVEEAQSRNFKGFGGRVGKGNRAAWTELHEHRNGCYQCPPAEVQNALRGGCHVASHYFDLVAGEVVERHPSERNTSRMLLDEAIQPSRC